MRSSKKGGTMLAIIGGMNAALAARHALMNAAIFAEVVNADSEGRGCGYGVVFPASQYGNVRTILSAARIGVRRYETKET